MGCTTILVGKKASYNGATMIARNDDSGSGSFAPKKLQVIHPNEQLRKYKSVISHVEIDLPEDPMKYTAMPDALQNNGIWAAAGVNEENVAMSATETITSNARVLAADPLVSYKKLENGEEIPGGIGEEDIVYITLPYIHSAKEGVIRLGSLLETYGTYEMNGIVFQDADSIWYLETIGGHHWMAKRVKDDEYVMMPNQLGIDSFDFNDAYGEQKEYLCSNDLKEFVEKYHLDLSMDGTFNPRDAFGSHTDSDHVYNTPRAWYIGRYFNPNTYDWNDRNGKYGPTSDFLPWSLVPEKKITPSDIKYILSSHFQGTEYDPYGSYMEKTKKGEFRTIGINRNNFVALIEIRGDKPKEIQAIEWIAEGSNAFNALVPFYASMEKAPEYLANTTKTVSTDNFYWANRLIGALADATYATAITHIERYQLAIEAKGLSIINAYDEKIPYAEDSDALIAEANNKIVEMLKKDTNDVLDKVLYEASMHMKNAYARSDN